MRRVSNTLIKALDSALNSPIPSITDASPIITIPICLRRFSSVDSRGGGGRFPRRERDRIGDKDDIFSRKDRGGGGGGGAGRFPRSDRDRISDKDDIFSRKNGGNFGGNRTSPAPPEPIPGRPLRGESRMTQFPRQDVSRSRGGVDREDGSDYRGRGGSDRSRSRPRGVERGKSDRLSRDAGSFSGDERVDEVGGDDDEEMGWFGDDDDDDEKEKKREKKKKSGDQPSIREFLKKPLKEEDEKGDREFLARFKLGGDAKKEEDEKEDKNGDAKVGEEENAEEQPKDSDLIFKKMKETGLIPNAVAMLDGLCKDGLVHEAMKIFGLMREKGTMPEVIVYTAVVDGFCQAHKFEDAKRIFKKMQTNGIVPNAFSYGVLVRGLCKGKILDEAVEVCVEMLEAGHSPNVATLTGLVHELCKEKGGEEARRVVETLKQKGYYLDEKSVRDYLDKKGPLSPMVREAIFGPKKRTEGPF